ncbi:hypothetical protein HNR23_004909 [Nocardiopsis mwathae]|uniref:DUF2599 domain-containing protein n=1 Tax=Nocardiopsis mwathae TaxID=1472723 RepID=A0A7W9YMG2_9ACTN|nr:DUF2599 domain-containing protein [Nocardiopsis mwathae]MBB6174849.1 hypothetical protein [Nocardiopsis mwathae]
MSTVATASLVALGLATGPAAVANATVDPRPNDLRTALTSAEPETVENLSDAPVTQTGEYAIAVLEDDVSATVPVKARDGITISREGGSAIRLSLPFSEEADDAVAVMDGVVSYDNKNGSTTVPAVKEDGSVAVNTVIDGAHAPLRYDYELDVPEGSSLELTSDGSVVVLDAQGEFVGGVAPPWAKDAQGTPVPTHYELDGTELVQVVEHRSEDVVYPVVADPYLGIKLISKVQTVNEKKGKRYKVTPTLYGRTMPVLAHRPAFQEVQDIAKIKFRQNLYDQFRCHPLSGIAIVKGTWNLESWRPNVGLAKTMAKKCNP